MTAADDPRKTTSDAFVVAVSDHGQHALWRADSALPAGWRRQSAAMSRRACLDAIAALWPDITPASVRAVAAGGTAAGGTADGPVRPFIHEMVAEQATRRPEATAVMAAGTRLTYRELDQSANRLARYLAGLGAGPETVIGVHLDRGAEAIRGLLGIMKAGCGYLPLDPSLPPARLARMCAEARPVAVLTDRADVKLPAGQARLVVTGAPELARQPATAPEVSLHPDHIGYAIYTSGSTGQPKAVAVSHGALACMIGEIAGEYQISAGDRVAQLAPLAFDTSIEQVLVTLTRGATLMLPPPGTIAPTDLLRYLEREQVTVIDLTPAYWHQLLAITEPDDERLRSLRLMITGGDMADAADCRAARRAAPAARLLNAYGLTETTITSALADLSAPPEAGPVPVGRATRHVRIMILDENLDPAPAGTTGEIYIGGRGVARGYLGRPALTAERFLPDPWGAGSRMYRTGDLGRWRADGQLEVSGRADRQLKVRGFRIEPGEIESALAAHPDIGQVAVVATGQGPGDQRLAAYYTLRRPGGRPPGAGDMRGFLRARLPGHMIPAAFIPLDQMPPAPEGAPALGRPGHAKVTAPEAVPGAVPGERRTPTQAGMTYLWSKLLKKDQVSLDDDFFALGGNSLLAAEMLARTRVMFGIGADFVRPLTRCLLRDPTLRGFAQATQDARAGRLATDGDQGQIDFAREAELAPVRVQAHPRCPRPDWRRPLEILLTGATGFLGAHLLSELLASTSARVWCLVRARDAAHGRQRLADAAARYDLGGAAGLAAGGGAAGLAAGGGAAGLAAGGGGPGDRVVPLPGDLAAPRLGLSPGEFRDLARSTDVIYHAGAVVNFIYPYEELRAANVTGTREVIRLAGLVRAIPVHYVSTTAVLAGLGVAGVREATEDTPLAHADRLRVGYVETKFVAEELLRNAGRAGLPVAIYRPMDIVGSRRTGAWNTATEMCALIRFITDTGLAPDIDLPLDFAPADTCAAAIRHISCAERAAGRTYHLAGPGYPLLGYLVERLRRHGFEVSQVPFGIWVSELLRYAAHDPSHPMAPFLPLFVDRDQGLTTAEMYLEHVFPHYTRSNTEQALRGSGIVFPPVDDGLLDRNIGHLIATGYLTARDRRPRAHGG